MPKAATIDVQTRERQELVDLTAQVKAAIRASGIESGIAVVFCPHTTAAIAVNENTDPDVRSDLLQHFRKLVPKEAGFRHGEGNADAHILNVLTGPAQTFIVEGGKPLLGRWQAIYLVELDGPRSRQVFVKVVQG